MAATRKKKNSSPRPWILAAAAVVVTIFAVLALLSDERLKVSPGGESKHAKPAAKEPIDLEIDPHSKHRDMIDQESRDKLREILRAESDSD